MKLGKVSTFLLFNLLCINVYAEGFSAGVAVTYLSGMKDLSDLYESNLENDPNVFVESDVTNIPIGVGFRGKYEMDFGLRTDFAVGPLMAFIIEEDDGDDETFDTDFAHIELPLSVTLGYNFVPRGGVSPYIRAGFAYHLVNGDYDVSSSAGLLAAIGLEFGRGDRFVWGLEAGVDDSTVEFVDFANFRTVELNTVDAFLSLYFLF